ncbi:hypothetical protein DOK76_03760 [Vagococcus sp. DIV0080]|uniref:Uncharacterized protein n=1 Tax=Candidatus Vagococcus giribetii TaxID=2230876 RepID=A0ABS3HQZ2_9ENTE|nr:hypothetical protein [Vagococcus sp. DIV0080]MBO0476172.1 hypothetical protein [Vagococcus sp. DIV0080]
MFKIMYVPKHLRKISYAELLEKQDDLIKKAEDALTEAIEVKKENEKIQADLLMTLGNLNKCSDEDLKVMQTIATNYMKVSINKEKLK